MLHAGVGNSGHGTVLPVHRTHYQHFHDGRVVRFGGRCQRPACLCGADAAGADDLRSVPRHYLREQQRFSGHGTGAGFPDAVPEPAGSGIPAGAADRRCCGGTERTDLCPAHRRSGFRGHCPEHDGVHPEKGDAETARSEQQLSYILRLFTKCWGSKIHL